VQDIPGSAYFSSVPLVAVVAPKVGRYETDVRGIGLGTYIVVTALVDGQTILMSQTVTGPTTSGLLTVYSTTCDPSTGSLQTSFDLGRSLDFFLLLSDQLLVDGKITNSGIANSLSTKLSSGRESLAANDISGARGDLRAFRNEVKAQRGKHIAADVADDLFAYDSYLLTLLG